MVEMFSTVAISMQNTRANNLVESPRLSGTTSLVERHQGEDTEFKLPQCVGIDAGHVISDGVIDDGIRNIYIQHTVPLRETAGRHRSGVLRFHAASVHDVAFGGKVPELGTFSGFLQRQIKS